ncbi:hypothetical protein ANCDUO_08296 [Ancylostoma duodenale]|uniref:Uncharacterized protein n=1 Tax=Ancylostoma duodenale TaxID=51022 RepID=A0A0C2GJR3_9BILA|nr:hypothetical protein ANCDUO_08296 [Ancylostoma duodenale]
MAFQRCIDWTEFVCNTKKIVEHAPIDGNYFDTSYDEALRSVREEMERDAVKARPEKNGPVGYLAGEGALALEKDGMRGEILTRMALTFDKVLEILEEWSACRTWIITLPIDEKMDEAKSRKLLQFVKSQVSSGGKVVTAWPPVNEKNASRWNGLIDLWKSLDETLSRIDDRHQIFVTAGSTLVHGKLVIEAGSPESCCQYYCARVGAGVPKSVYEAIRRKVPEALLPVFPDMRFGTSRTMSYAGEGMYGRADQKVPAKRARHF